MSYRRAALLCCCSLKTIAIINENLHKENLKAFEESCFGPLLEMNPLTARFQAPLLLHLLMHINTTTSKNNALVFNINNSTIKFEATDFESITGLPLATTTTTTTLSSSRIHKDVFHGSPTIKLKDIEEAFLDACGSNGELSLKLALLYFLYGVVIPVSHNKRVDIRYLHIADDLPAFLAFPWGRVGYEFLVSSLLSARLRLDGASCPTNLAVPSFTFALQVWAYQNMPSLAKLCKAARVRGFERFKPRILRWSVTKFIQFDHLQQFFTLGGGDEALSDDASLELQNVKVEPLTSISTNTTIPQEERRRADSEDVVESLRRNESDAAAEVEDEEATKEVAPAKHSRLHPNPISANKLQSSLSETERIESIVAVAFDDNFALDRPQPLSKTFIFEVTKAEYERIKVLYEALLDRTNRLKLWISYAKFEAFALIQGSQTRDKRKRLERGRVVFERGNSYFKSRDPKMKEERRMLLEAWFDVEYRFGEDGDIGSVRAKLPQKLKKTRLVRTMDGSARYEECIDYLFPDEKDVEILKKHKTSAN